MNNFKFHIVSLLLICFMLFSAHCNCQNTRKNKVLGEQFIETLNSNNYAKFISLFDDECMYEEVCSGRKYLGKEDIQTYIRSTIEGMPDTKFITVSICSDEKYVVVEWVWHGTNSVGWPAMGIQASNKTMQLKGVSVIETINGKIKNVKDYWDWNSFTKGIGITN